MTTESNFNTESVAIFSDSAVKKESLTHHLTTGLQSTQEILDSLTQTIKAKKEIEDSEKILKSMLNLKPGESINGGEISVTCSLRKTIDFSGNKEYENAIAEVKKIESYLKLSNNVETKETVVLTAKLIKL